MFVYTTKYMFGIDMIVVCYCLAIDPSIKPVSKKGRKLVRKKRITIDEKFHMLTSYRQVPGKGTKNHQIFE